MIRICPHAADAIEAVAIGSIGCMPGARPGSREVAPTTGVHWCPVPGGPVEYNLWNQAQAEKNAPSHLTCWDKSVVNLWKSIG